MGARAVVLQALGRAFMLLVWALVGWGALLVASALAASLSEGPATAFARLLPSRDAAIWGWLAPFSVLLALVAAVLVAALSVVRRSGDPASRED
jgi:hypothetical protein